MRRTCITLMLGACLGILGMRLSADWKELAAHAEADSGDGAGTPSSNGDVNGDGVVDLSDAVYTLNWLFLGSGAPPVPIECPPGALPATGQTKCYDTDGTEIDCGSADWPGQDGFYQTSCPSGERFIPNDGGTPADSSDDTVTDTCTGLVWQKDTVPGTYTWQNALKYCENLSLGGRSDWRLPNVRELQSIVDYRSYELSIDPIFGAVFGVYWSTTTDVYVPDCAWVVSFRYGHVNGFGHYKTSSYSVRAVRSGP